MQISLNFEGSSSTEQLLIDKKINSGKFNVYHSKFSHAKTECALKVFPKSTVSKKIYLQEKYILSQLKHRNIISYIPLSSHSLDCHILLTEYAPYGNFHTLVVQKLFNSEKIIRTYFHQLIEAIEYVHSKEIVHLDIKLENLLLDHNFQLKLADFDQAQSTRDKTVMSRGTPNYRAPEMVAENYKDLYPIDIYGAGISLFAIKTGQLPFLEADSYDHDLFYKDNKAFWERKIESKDQPGFFEQSFMDLINVMLVCDPEKRLTIKEIKESEWYKGPIYDNKGLCVEMERLFERTFTNFTKMKSF